ncbi:MAG: hypothetical protein IJ710_06120 [Prevotella sp.]|nr:hypothetical protein [Prevotella sp.]
MQFLLITVIALVALGVVAALCSAGSDDSPIQTGNDCASCSSRDDGSCKIACLMEEARQKKEKQTASEE